MLFKRIGAFFLMASILLGLVPAFTLPVWGTSAVQAENNKYYFFDSSIVNWTQNAELEIGQVEKSTTNATWLDQYAWTVDSDIPDWEQRVTIMDPHVEYDAQTRKYQIWYEALYTASPTAGFDWRANLIDAANSNNVALGSFRNTAKGTIYDGKDVLCYMESSDGINWTRPDCGEFYYKTQDGQIIGTNIVFIGNHGNGVERNEHPDPNEPKYLIAGRAYEVGPDSYAGTEPVGVAISWSEDGIHWEAPVTIKCSYECADDISYIRADTHNQLKYSPELGRYIVITRGYASYAVSVRQVVYLEAKDSLVSIRDMAKVKENATKNYWEATSEYWTDGKVTLDLSVTADAQPYSMPSIHVADGYYIGVVSMADFANDQKGVWNQVHVELTWSPDGINWYYMDKGTPFIENAETFAFEYGNDYGMIYCAAPIEVGDEVQIYYAALPELHYTTYSDIPVEIRNILDVAIPKAAAARSFTRTTALNIATIGKDRYAGYAAEKGLVTTNPFGVSGGVLNVTADVAQGGSLKIAVLNSAGKVIQGYGFDDFVAITESVTDHAVRWGKKTLSDLAGQRVSFQIQLSNASVYTLSGNIEKLAKLDIIPAEEKINITKGETAKVALTFVPAGDYRVTFTSNNEKVAKVDSIGVVTGVSAGVANIFVTVENSAYSFAIPVTVTDKPHLECSDNNRDHYCDTCGSRLTSCVDKNKDNTCDICNKKSAHIHELKLTVAVESTCTKAGNSAYWTCSGCGKYFADAEAKTEIEKDSWILPTVPHSFTNYESDKNASCTVDGTKTAKCDNCDVTDTKADEGSKLPHSFTNYESDKNATNTDPGTKTAKCDNCDVTDTKAGEGSAGHTLVKVDEVPATKEVAGVKEHWTCSTCSKLFADAEGKQETTLEELTIPQVDDNSGLFVVIAVAIVVAASVTALVIIKKRYF